MFFPSQKSHQKPEQILESCATSAIGQKGQLVKRIPNLKSKSRIPNPKSIITNPETQIPNPN